jgi:zinc protease
MMAVLAVRRLIFGAALMVAVSGAGAQKIQLPPVARTRLANGIRLVIMEYHRAPTVIVSATFAGGDRLDPEGKTGATSLMTQLLKRGTETRTAPQIAEAIDYLGGALGTGADSERCTASLDILAKDTDAGLDLMADVLRRPTFPDAELERERSLEVSSLQSIGEDPGTVAAYVLTDAIYSGHPYGREATVSTIKAITRDDILSCYRKALSPDRMIVVAVGDFKAAEMEQKLRARFGDWAPGGEAVQPTPPPSLPAPSSAADLPPVW